MTFSWWVTHIFIPAMGAAALVALVVTVRQTWKELRRDPRW